MTMIAIGGSVGSGLFVGSGVVIHAVGPAAVVSYAIAGAMVLLTLRALGEMVVARPSAGAFADYARMALGPWAGFCIGWLYWWLYAVLIAAEAVAGAALLAAWVDAPPWVLSLVLMVAMTGANLVSVRVFGETESVFSLVKVATIAVFLVMGVLFAAGWWPGAPGGAVANLWAHGGFAPQGWAAVLAAVVVVLFSFGGVEIPAIAAGESDDPVGNVARATTNVVWRIALFYIASLLVVVTVLPWDTVSGDPDDSPFVAVMAGLGVPGAGTIMQIVVFIAVLSVLNAAMYTSSRMLHVLTRQGDAPAALAKLTRRGVPARALLAGTVVGFASVAANYMWPASIFWFLVNSIGAILLVLFITILVSHLVLGVRMRRAGEAPAFRMWGFPYLSAATLLALVAVLVAMVFMDAQRPPLAATAASAAVVGLACWARGRFGARPPSGRALDLTPGGSAPGPGPGPGADPGAAAQRRAPRTGR
ncbi:amino acid permease [Murinocardiopsis flavida]|uniref:amino acid permease n=1 Tax=Murinocardiopsis flavida TaxID=645275 RepID=UPI000D0D9D33|nr:amino acid permease [Murinocardiopsis flavida]